MALDRKGIADAIRDFLKADTTTLYGDSKYLQLIESNAVYFTKAKVSNKNPNALYLWVSSIDTQEERMQNGDYRYMVDMRFESKYSNPDDAIDNIDNALERVNKLLNTEIRDGNDLSSYYTDTNAMVIDIVPTNSTLSQPLDENGVINVEIEGAITVIVNRWE